MKLQKGDMITARPAAPREEGTGRILFIPSAYEKPLTVTKVMPCGVKTKERGFIHRNCILSNLTLNPKQNGEK